MLADLSLSWIRMPFIPAAEQRGILNNKLQIVQIVPINQFCDLQITQDMINALFYESIFDLESIKIASRLFKII